MKTLADKLKEVLKVQQIEVTMRGNPPAFYVVLTKDGERITTARTCTTRPEAEEVANILNESLEKSSAFSYEIWTDPANRNYPFKWSGKIHIDPPPEKQKRKKPTCPY